MSEVIYDISNYYKILELIVNLLGEEGYCLIASKIFYFGVGGSIAEFLEFAETNFKNLLFLEILHNIDNKKGGNKRQIIKITKQ
jgi:hypothetical protein